MNTLIKFVVTTVIGLFGTLDHVDEARVNIHDNRSQVIELNSNANNGTGFCRFNESSCIKIKYMFET